MAPFQLRTSTCTRTIHFYSDKRLGGGGGGGGGGIRVRGVSPTHFVVTGAILVNLLQSFPSLCAIPIACSPFAPRPM